MKRKRFKATKVAAPSPASRDTELQLQVPPSNTRVEFPWESGTAHRSFDFGPHYGCEIDLIVAWCQQVIEWHVEARVHRIATISACCKGGLRYFFRFSAEVATERGAPLTLTDITRELIERFIHWLALRGDLSYRTQNTVYRNVKFALGSLEGARDPWKDRVWLYRATGPTRFARGPIRLLGVGSLMPCIERFVTRNRLRSDDGSPLRLSVSRLRKTLENRLWRLSGGDPFAVASLMGHGVRVADRHYFVPTPEMERNHKFLGEALVASWSGQEKLVVAAPNSTNTPVGRCRDPYGGHLAPKDGQPCMDFLSCFRCPSYVLVEEEDDLWRLYSFYWFLIRERSQLGAGRWASVYGWIVRLIDDQITARFNSSRIRAVREKARRFPHPFWKHPHTLEAARAL